MDNMHMNKSSDMPLGHKHGVDGMDMNNGTDMDMGMNMYFHIGYEKYILLEQWVAETDGAMFGTCFFFFVLALLYEVFKYYRQLHSIRAHNNLLKVNVSEDTERASNSTTTTQESNIESANEKLERPLHRDNRPDIKLLSTPHLIQTALHMIQMFVSYILMLAFMSFNVWICLSVILGAGVGYFVIGCRKVSTYSLFDDDHCH